MKLRSLCVHCGEYSGCRPYKLCPVCRTPVEEEE